MTGSRWSMIRGLALGSVQLAAVVGLVFGTVTLSNYMRENQPERVKIDAKTFVPSVETVRVSLETRQIMVTKTGSVEPSVYVNHTPSVSGRIEAVAPGLGGGAMFKAEDVLFEIASDDLEIELRRREADLAAAQANLDIELAQSENARREWDSFGRGEITDLAARGPQVRSAEAQVLTAQANLDAAQLDLDRAGFSLPFDGRIVELSLALGQKVTEGQSFGRAYSFDDIEVVVSLSTAEMALLGQSIGTQVSIEAGLFGEAVELTGTVERQGAEVNRTTRLTNLIIGLDRGEVQRLQVQPGTLVPLTLYGDEFAGVTELPNAALQEGDQVWLIEDGALRKSTSVEVILRGPNSTLITGLNDGDVVAIGTIAGARDGLRIQDQALLSQMRTDLALRAVDASDR